VRLHEPPEEQVAVHGCAFPLACALAFFLVFIHLIPE